MLCIGYGKFPPNNTAELFLTMCSMTIGATFYAVFIGMMSTLLMSIDSSGRQYKEKVSGRFLSNSLKWWPMRVELISELDKRLNWQFLFWKTQMNSLVHFIKSHTLCFSCNVSFIQYNTPNTTLLYNWKTRNSFCMKSYVNRRNSLAPSKAFWRGRVAVLYTMYIPWIWKWSTQ